MKLVFAVDAIFPPLTGIGRYALELASRLPFTPGVDEVKYLAQFSWAQPSDFNVERSTPNSFQTHSNWLAKLRIWAAGKTSAVEVYDILSEVWRARLLESATGAVYHSPNYFLAEHNGPSVATVHDLSILKFPEAHPAARCRYFELAFERSLKRADMLITDSEAIRQELLTDFSLPPHKVRTIHLGVDTSFYPRSALETAAVLRKYGLVHGAYCLSVATLEPRKKLDQLIKAYALLPPDLHKKYPLVLVGSKGWLSTPLHLIIERATRAGWLRFLGYVPQTDLPFVYAGARAYAMTSVYEGFGLPLVESMSSGVPVLATNASSMPEITGDAALLVPNGDTSLLLEGLNRLLTDTCWRNAAIQTGISRARSFSWENCLQKTVEVYNLLENKAKSL